ncbi:flagellin [Bacillus tianshenii]|nr:flagellin [Bacillus tianshenii]
MRVDAANTQQLAMMRLSSGQRINSAADDAAGLAISELMRGQVRGEDVATRNMRDSQSMYATAEGALNASHSVLQRMRGLSVQANNGMLTDSDRAMIQQEFSQLRDSLDSIGRYTQYNTKNLLDGSLQEANTTVNANGESMQMSLSSALAANLGDGESGMTLADVNLQSNPEDALKVIDGAIAQISDSRSTIGAKNNRLDHAINVSTNKQVNMQAAESRIRDADIAQQVMEMNRSDLLQQTYFATQKMQQNMAGQLFNALF